MHLIYEHTAIVGSHMSSVAWLARGKHVGMRRNHEPENVSGNLVAPWLLTPLLKQCPISRLADVCTYATAYGQIHYMHMCVAETGSQGREVVVGILRVRGFGVNPRRS